MLKITPLLIGQMLAVSLYAFDELAVTTMMPHIKDQLQGEELYGAAFAIYLLASLISIIWAGEQTDKRGPSFPFLVGIILFGMGNLTSALAQDMVVFVSGRGIQGLGGGCLTAVVYASINIGYEEKDRPKALSYMSASWAIPAVIAPGIAAYITENFSWRLVFFVLTGLVVLTALLALPGLRKLNPEAERQPRRKSHLALLLSLSTALVLYGLSVKPGWLEAGLIVAGAIIMVAMVHQIAPAIWLMRTPIDQAINIKSLAIFVFFGLEIFLPLLFVHVYNLSLIEAGMILTAAALGWSSTTFVQARLVKHFSTRNLVVYGLFQFAAGMAVLSLLIYGGAPAWVAYIAWAITGSAMGLIVNTLIASAMKNTPEGNEGNTSTLNALSDSLTIALASGLGGAFFNWGLREQVAKLDLFRDLLVFMGIFLLVTIVFAFRKLSGSERVG